MNTPQSSNNLLPLTNTGHDGSPVLGNVNKILSRSEIEGKILKETQEVIPMIFGSKLDFSFICGGIAGGYWQANHDIDFFVCLNAPMTAEEEEKYLQWYQFIHSRYGFEPDYDYPGEVIERDKLIKTLGKLHGLCITTFHIDDVLLKKAIIWCDMLNGPVKGIAGDNIDLLHILQERYSKEPKKWKEQLLRIMPDNEVQNWEDKSHTLIMEHYMQYPKGDGRTKRPTGYLNPLDSYKQDPILEAERFEPIDWVISLNKQASFLRGIFPEITLDEPYFKNKNSRPIPKGLQRILIPKLSFLAKHYGVPNAYENIGELIEHITNLIEQSRSFTNYRKGQLGADLIRFDNITQTKRSSIETTTPGDILVVDIDLGSGYTGFSPRRAKYEITQSSDKIALSSVDIAMLLLMNPTRISADIDLSIDSVAETYFSQTRGWVANLFFYFRKSNGELSRPVKNLEFGYRWNKRPYSDSGAAYFIP